MSEPFVKIYGSKLLKSTLWMECVEARLLFLGMLAEADEHGVVDIPSVKVLAHRMNMTVEQTERGLAVLEAPDEESRSADDDGRRVVREGRVWRIVNSRKYREMRTENQERDRLRKIRERASDTSGQARTDSDSSDASESVQDKTDAATDLDLDLDLEKKRDMGTSPPAPPAATPPMPGLEPEPARAPKADPVFAHWVKVMGKDPSRTLLTGDRKGKLKARRREKYTDAQLCQAIDGCRLSEFHMGKNDRGELYNDLATILRDGRTVDGHIQRLAVQRPPSPLGGAGNGLPVSGQETADEKRARYKRELAAANGRPV